MGKPKNIFSITRNAISKRKSRLKNKYLNKNVRQSSQLHPLNVNIVEFCESEIQSSEPLDPSSFTENVSNTLTNNVYQFNEINSSDDADEDEDTFAQELRECFILCGTPLSHISQILKIINKRYPSMPTDPRTLLETPKNLNIRKMGEGRYVHFGLKNELEAFIKRFSPSPQTLTLDIHIDGVQVSESSSNGLWTILCKLFIFCFD